MGEAAPNGSSHSNDSNSMNYSLATLGIHGDDPINYYTDVAPALHVATTFRYSENPEELEPEDSRYPPTDRGPDDPAPADSHVYSRLTSPGGSRLELLLSKLLKAPCLTYSSGLSAFHALIVYLHPKVVAIGAGYHGCHGVLRIYQKLTNCKIVDLFDDSTWQNEGEGWSLGKGDVVHLETPVNPLGRAYNIEHFAKLAHKRGAYLTIDATFAPPPLQNPFEWGADFVMHSGTKYIGGHSDMLCGVIAFNNRNKGWEEDFWKMVGERVYLGAVMGSMENWLGVRSLRTFELRIMRQSQNASALTAFINDCLNSKSNISGADDVRKVVQKLDHASLQTEDFEWLRKQMPNGYGPVFSMWCQTREQAKRLPSKLELFHHATSLGGVESLIEWRRMSDKGVEETLLRVSVGAENIEDLKADLIRGFQALVKEGW